ncbi:hypothetical protein [Sutterella megalosphaeroides]|uniref:Uncharacterized protein n=1 Tax=Sutterella megalosphaeroides TaxID=2494234 RepID=A0A2Z6I9H3_9BURK|nr:hypothetical protein [Sutterella megalosphaeroides]BBF23004.1 hypothetical protein SUTMEG_08950 [Sutterella megalosphaeroides]
MTKTILIGALVAGLSLPVMSAQAAEVWYSAAPLEVNAAPGSDYLGTLDVATPVTVLEKKGDMAKVRISGWSLKEYPSQIFKEAGLRIEYASFDEEKAVKLDGKSGEKTVQGNVWQKSSAEGWVPAKSLTKDINGLWKQAAERHGDACSSCHGAPKADHFTANQWASQLPVRGGRTGHTRRGNNALMFKWLQENAKPL